MQRWPYLLTAALFAFYFWVAFALAVFEPSNSVDANKIHVLAYAAVVLVTWVGIFFYTLYSGEAITSQSLFIVQLLMGAGMLVMTLFAGYHFGSVFAGHGEMIWGKFFISVLITHLIFPLCLYYITFTHRLDLLLAGKDV